MTWSAGMTRKGEGIAGSTVMTGSVEMRVGTEVAPEACNSSPGNANRLLAHKWVKKKAVTQIHCGNMPCDILPPSSLYTPALRPPPGVMPAHAAVTSTPPPSSLYTPPLRPPPRRHSCAGRNLNANCTA